MSSGWRSLWRQARAPTFKSPSRVAADIDMIRALHTSRAVRSVAVTVPAAPVRKVGAVRGGFTGFLFGVSVTGAAAYYYLFDQYQAGQQAILSDVITLRESLQDLQKTIDDLKGQASK